MPEVTPFIGLKKPLESETADISVINDNVDRIDSALGDLASIPTSAKDAAGAIAELFEALENAATPNATLTTKGKVQLSSATNSIEEDRASTPKAVKAAVDAAAAAQTTANAAQTKAIAALPSSSYTAADVLAKIKTVDGSGSGLDADVVRGLVVGSSRFPDNWKTAYALPSSYAELGETIFFANSAGGWPSTYGTVVTVKSYSAVPCTQFFYPYISDAPPKYRNAIFGSDSWTEWRTFWDTSQLRINAGQLEFLNGGTWKVVGGSVKVQRGLAYTSSSQGTTESRVTISPVSLDKAWVKINLVALENNFIRAYSLENSTTLLVEHKPRTDTSYGFRWEVVEYA